LNDLLGFLGHFLKFLNFSKPQWFKPLQTATVPRRFLRLPRYKLRFRSHKNTMAAKDYKSMAICTATMSLLQQVSIDYIEPGQP
jgi:hypothetical protein